MENIKIDIHTKNLHSEKEKINDLFNNSIKELEKIILEKYSKNKIKVDLTINKDTKWNLKLVLIFGILWKGWKRITLKKDNYQDMNNIIIDVIEELQLFLA